MRAYECVCPSLSTFNSNLNRKNGWRCVVLGNLVLNNRYFVDYLHSVDIAADVHLAQSNRNRT